MASLSPRQLPKKSCQPSEEDTRLGRKNLFRSTRGYVPDLPADWSRPVTSIELEALHKRASSVEGNRFQERIDSDCSSETVTALRITTDGATGTRQGRRSTRARRGTAASGVYAVEGFRGHLNGNHADGVGDTSLLVSALTSKGPATQKVGDFGTQNGNRTWSATSSCLATAVILLLDATQKSTASPVRSMSTLTDQETPCKRPTYVPLASRQRAAIRFGNERRE
jgi:hypothetical protein